MVARGHMENICRRYRAKTGFSEDKKIEKNRVS
jgi:hypothetical protein